MTRAARIVLCVLLLAQVAWSLLYIERTSFLLGEERVFVLWDDAMISMRYARNLSAGDGLVWNPGGERVQGFTNLGLTLLMAGFHALPLSPRHTSLAVQLAALAALLASLLLAARIAADATGNRWAGVGAASTCALFTPHWIFGLQGADTAFVTVLLLLAVADVVRARARQAPWPTRSFVPLWLAMLVRPDAALFAGSAVVIATLLSRRAAADLRPAAIGLAGTFATGAALVVFSLAYYGEPLPNTYYLKATGAPLTKVLAIGAAQLASLGLGLLPAAAAVTMTFARGRRHAAGEAGTDEAHRSARWLLGGLTLVAASYHLVVGGDWLPEYGSRHLVQVAPLWLTLAAIGCHDALASRTGSSGRTPRGLLLALCVGLTLLANPGWPLREWFDPAQPTLLRAENIGNFSRAEYLRGHTTPDTTVAAHWAGVGPYFAERPTIDVLGRADRHIARLEVDRFIPGHSKWDWDYVIDERQPDIVDILSRGLIGHPGFRANYLIARLGPTAHLFVRRDAVDQLLDPTVELLPIESTAIAPPAASD